MRFSLIKTILVIGIIWIIIASMLEIVFNQNPSIFFYASIIGQWIFLFGLIHIDKQSKSRLSAYYTILMLISIAIYITNASHHNNAIMQLLLSLFFLFMLFLYLHAFSKMSRIKLFIRSFYTLIICVLCGIILLRFTNIVEHSAIVSFVIAFMIFPPLIMYITAIFSLNESHIKQIQ